MSIQAALWRMVLCISLILNGSALAATSMPMSPSLAHQPADRTAVGAGRSSLHAACHEQAAVVVAAYEHTPSSPTPAKGKHATPDCCPAGNCACVCLPALPGTVVAGFDPMAVHALGSGHGRARHDEPALPHLIRPPIG